MSENSGLRIVGISVLVVLLVAAGVAGWYGFVYQPKQQAIEKARLEKLAKEEAAKKAAEQAAKNEATYKKLIDDADIAFENGDWQSASSLYSEASSLFPSQKYPKDQLKIVNTKLDEIAELEARRAAGIVERLDSTTGRYYVIVSSSIDDDLALDYANKLASEGNAVKILEHDTGKLVYFRVAVADYASREAGEAALSKFTTYGDDVWVLGY